MGSPGPSPDVTPGEALGVFSALDEPSTPLTASEVAEELNCTRRTAHRKLEKLTEQGNIETKKPGAHSRVWWQPAATRGSDGSTGNSGSELEEFGDFVNAVEDYAIFTLDVDGTVATWNEGARRIKGYDEAEIVGEHFSQFYVEEDLEAGVPDRNLATAANDGRVEDEGRRLRADGTQFWANVVITANRDDDGELRGFTKITRDMTERREYEQRLEHERKRTERLLETAPIPIAVQDGNGDTVMANDRAQTVLGLSEEEIIEGPEQREEWTISDAKGDELPPEQSPVARVHETGEPVSNVAIAIEDPEGERSWFSINAAPLTGTDGDEEQVVVAGEDVTALKERQRELETELSEILGRVSDAFYALDDEWRFSHVNEQAADVLQRSEEDLIGREVWDVFPDARDGIYWENLHAAMDEQEQVNFEVYEEGIDTWLEFTVYPSESGLSIYFQDVTDRKAREQELAQYETIVETMNDGIYVKDPEGRFTMVNEAYAEMTGYDREELVGEHASIVVDEETMDAAKEMVAEEADGPTMETNIETADGGTVPAEGTFAPLDTGEEVGVVRDVTERKERERELERYRRIVENVPVGVYRNSPGPDGEFVEANQAVADIFDAESVEEIVEYDVSDLYTDPDQRAEFSRNLEEEGVVRDVELEQETLDGETIWISVTAIRTEEDGEAYFDGIVQDVTERREYEQDLRQYEVLVTESRDVSGIMAPDGTFRELTPSAAGVLGYEPEELVGENAFDYVHPDDRERVAEEYARLVEDPDQEPSIEYRFEHGDGSWIYLESRGRNLLDEPEIEGIVVYSRDVTERRERERRLEERERQLSTLMDNVPGMVYRCGNERGWPMEFVSEGCRELTGYDPDAIERNEVSYGADVVHEDDRDELWQAVQDGIDEDGSFNVHYRIRTPEGEVRWVRERGRGIRDEEGELTTVEGVIIDVTERKQAQEELEQERDMFAQGPAVTFRWVPDDEAGWPVEYVSENVRDVLGYSSETLESGEVPYVDLLLDEDRDRIAEEVASAVESGAERFTHEPYRIRTGNGDVRWMQDSTKIIRDENGDVERFLGYLVDITERKERELELSRYETMVETVNDGIYVVDEDGRFQMVNDAYAEMLGYEPDALLGEHVSLVVDEETGHAARKVEAEMREGAVDNPVVEAELDTASGEQIPSEATFAMLPSAGEEDHRIGVARDITERKEYERELERKERRYQAVFEDPNILVGLLEPDGTVLDINETAMEYVEADLEDVAGESFWETPWWGSGDGLQTDVKEWVLRAANGEYVDFEADLTRPDGQQYTLSGVFRPVTNDDGEVVSIIVSDRDVTERVERERELEDARSRQEAAMEAGAVGTWEWDIQDDSMVANRSFARTFGIDPDAASDGVSLDRFVSAIHEDDRERVEREIEEAVETCGEFEAEYRVWTVDDELRWVVARGHVECDVDGNAVTFPGALTDITERKEYQRRIEESEQRYRTLVENFPDGAVGLFDEDLRYTAVGGQFLEQAGVPAEERIGESVHEIYPDELVDQVEPYFRATLEGETNAFDAEYHGRHLHATTLPVTDADDEVIGGMLVVQDVTERREAQRELRESEAKFRMLAENLEEIVWMATPDAEEFVYLNPAFEEVWDIDRADIYDEPFSFLDAVHPDDREYVREQFQALPEQEFDEEFRIRRSDGDVRWVHARGASVHDEDEEMVRVVGIGEDVTGRVERERELERALDLLERAERIADVGAWEIDPDTEDVFWSDHLFDILQIEGEEEPPLEEALDEYHEDDRPVVEEAVDQALDAGEAFDVEVRSHTGAGEVRWLRVQGDPDTVDGDVVSLRGAVQDVTERVQRERRLESLVDKLEESNERLERFAYVASHDLQEPLRMISNYLQLLERRYADDLDEDAEEFIDFAVDGAERMREMISDLLAYSRLDTEAEPFEPVDAESVVDDVLDDLHLRIEETDADVTVDDLPTVEADRNQFQMIFQNLLSNAIKYSGEEPPSIDVDAERTDGEWLFHVSDDGIGMDPDHADDIFEVFNRLHTHEEYSGTGIGLAMCKKIVQRHSGDIWVESDPGEGSTFTFSVPADGIDAEGLLEPGLSTPLDPEGDHD